MSQLGVQLQVLNSFEVITVCRTRWKSYSDDLFQIASRIINNNVEKL